MAGPADCCPPPGLEPGLSLDRADRALLPLPALVVVLVLLVNTIDAVTDGAVSARGQVLASTPNSAQGSLTPSMSGRRRRADEMDSTPAARETTATDGQPSNMNPPSIVPTASVSPAVPMSNAGSGVNFHGSSSAPPTASALPSTSAHVGGYARPHAHSVSNASPAMTPSSNSNGMNNDIYPAKRQRIYSVGQASFQQPGLSSGHMHGARHSSISAGSHPIAHSGSTSQLGTPMGLVSVMSAPPAGMTAMSGGMNPAMNVPMDISTVGVGGMGLSSNGSSARARSSGNNVLNPMHTGQMS
ncbi:hypothetical protein KEM56_000921 [Ascosphaera pollenicola]|nr:hypothetical protein KEM56_000921 [Ascosphaera pollenicola]